MNHKERGKIENRNKTGPLVFFCFAGAFIVAFVLGNWGTTRDFELVGLSVIRGTFNQCTAILVTCIALIVPLTSNLYTPRLVRPYVSHPLIITGLAILVAGQILILVTIYFPKDTAFFQPLAWTMSGLYLVVLFGALPFLYGISQFLRPQYFMPMLTKGAVRDLRAMNRGYKVAQRSASLFDAVDVVTNIALTGMNRGDRQLVLLALQSMHGLFVELIGSQDMDKKGWRKNAHVFVPGLAREGKEYLMKAGTWPEAYMIAQMLKIMESSTKKQQEILAELAASLLDTALMAFILKRTEVVELHVMAFNTLMANAILEQDLRKFQNLSYYYRIFAEEVSDDENLMLEIARHLAHYAKTAGKQSLHFSFETVVYDLGELILNIANQDEEKSLVLLRRMAGKFLTDAISEGKLLTKVGWRCLIRIYWEAQAAGWNKLADEMGEGLLSDHHEHAFWISRVLIDNRELHTEFNDRLMRFAYITPAATDLARAFAAGVPEPGEGKKREAET